jgi:hypothetical protein
VRWALAVAHLALVIALAVGFERTMLYPNADSRRRLHERID